MDDPSGKRRARRGGAAAVRAACASPRALLVAAVTLSVLLLASFSFRRSVLPAGPSSAAAREALAGGVAPAEAARLAGERGAGRETFPAFEPFTSLVAAHSASLASPKRLRVCFATLALVGPIKNGGIATAVSALALALVEDGHRVTVLYLHGKGVQDKTFAHWERHYRGRGVELVALPEAKMTLSPSAPSKYVGISYRAFLWLRDRQDELDVVHFHEWHGAGYYSALAKHQGLAFARTQLWTTVHCPSLFYLKGSSGALTSPNNFASDFLERQQVLYSDVVVSPSAYMLRWVQSRGWRLPPHVFVEQNLVSERVMELARKAGRQDGAGDRRHARVEELVFFARIEVLKGVHEFCAALDLLAADVRAGRLRSFAVTFLGNGNLPGQSADEFVEKRRKEGEWPFGVKVITTYQQAEAVSYLTASPTRAVILASLAENSPYSVLECLTIGVPFIASDVGGTAELVAPEDRAEVMFEPRPAAIAARVRAAVADGLVMARGTSGATRTRREWVQFHRAVVERLVFAPGGAAGAGALLRARGNATRAPDGAWEPAVPYGGGQGDAFELGPDAGEAGEVEPLVTVCLITHERGDLVFKTVGALLDQDYANLELVVVDDGSVSEEALRTLRLLEEHFGGGGAAADGDGAPPFRLVRQANLYPGAARNNCVRQARGEYAIFVDDDDIPRRQMVSTMVRVAQRTGADVTTTMCDFFHGDGVPDMLRRPDMRWLPLGPAADLGMWKNVFGAYAALVRRSTFFEIGGFTEDRGTTYEDYEFLATAVLKGFRLELVPHPLLWYRQNPKSHLLKDTSRYLNRLRAARPYLASAPAALRNALHFGIDSGRSSMS